MKRVISNLILLVLLLGGTAAVAVTSVNRVNTFAQEKNQEKTAQVQQRLDATFAMLSELCKEPYICDMSVSFQEKAAFLTDKNQDENLGYMMIRILDEECNIYREDQEYSTSNLSSRDYMQRLYSTGVTQVTDAFLAGADGKTINYTVASAILDDNNKVVGSIFAAIYGTEIDQLLQDELCKNVLVGSQFQYMGGIPEDQFGLAVAQVLETEYQVSRPAENILLDFQEKRRGSFWGMGSDGIQYFAYSPMENCSWVVMTKVPVLSMMRNTLIGYGCGVVLILAAFFWVNRPKKTTKET